MGTNLKDTFSQINNLLDPYLRRNAAFGNFAFDQSKENLAGGTAGINNLIKYYSDFMSGNREDVLKNVDVSGITASYDQAAKDTAQFGVRGGRSSGTLAGLDFEKVSQINKIVQALRSNAPQQLQALFNSLLNVGTGELNTAIGANNANLSTVSGAINAALAKQASDVQARAALIGSIFEAAGGAAGTIIGAKIAKG